MRYTLILIPEPAGYQATAPAIPGCSAYGQTRHETLSAAAEAIRHWLTVEGFHGRHPLPETRALILDGVARAFEQIDSRRRADPSASPGYALEVVPVDVQHSLLA